MRGSSFMLTACYAGTSMAMENSLVFIYLGAMFYYIGWSCSVGGHRRLKAIPISNSKEDAFFVRMPSKQPRKASTPCLQYALCNVNLQGVVRGFELLQDQSTLFSGTFTCFFVCFLCNGHSLDLPSYLVTLLKVNLIHKHRCPVDLYQTLGLITITLVFVFGLVTFSINAFTKPCTYTMRPEERCRHPILSVFCPKAAH